MADHSKMEKILVRVDTLLEESNRAALKIEEMANLKRQKVDELLRRTDRLSTKSAQPDGKKTQ